MSEQQRKKSLTEKLIYDNKILMILCILVSVIIWATVKINYSADTVRTVSDIRASLGSTAEELDFTAFINEEDLLVDVEVTGKAYNINTHALTKDDIIAIKLLADSDKSITEVALASGFNTASYLILCFRNQYGITPSQFRKMHSSGSE